VAEPIVIVVERGGVVEARHEVHAVSVRDGAVVDSAGDPDLVTQMRSSAKPFQALPLALEEPDLPAEELAIACASHEAEPAQLEAVRALLARSASGEDDLECGPERGTRLNHNCSGKHAGMLLRTKRHGWPLPGYRLADHPLQVELHGLVAHAAGLEPGDVAVGVDGCGIPTFAMSLTAMALAYSRLAELDGGERILEVMRAHPQLVGGEKVNDTAFMREVPGAMAKRGAEGLLCATLADGTGVAAKVADGGNRAAGPGLAAFLGASALERAPVINSRCEEVGWIFPSR
jgi:L-asparaginase II